MTHVTLRGFSQKNSHKSDDAARVHIFVYYVCFADAIFECLQHTRANVYQAASLYELTLRSHFVN